MMWLGSLIFVLTFLIMEFLAWATHKYVMHGFMWHWHADHHKKDHDNWFERNDLFFIFYAIVSMSFILVGDNTSMWFGIPIGFGILAYGIAYFMVHDIFIHQRFKLFRNIDNRYARGIRRAHKIHHKNIGKEDSQNFGMLWVPLKYFRS